MSYILGLDIGINSIGFAGVQPDQGHILFANAHVFDAAETSDGASPAKPRRERRGQRRVIRRRGQRKRWIRRLLAEYGIKNVEIVDAAKKGPVEHDVWQLRKQALERKLTDAELARVLFHIAKRRGYQSNRKQAEPNDVEGKEVLKGARELEHAKEMANAETVGAYLATLEKKRNGDGDYSRMVRRDMLREEVRLIFKRQRDFGNDKATDELRERFEDLAFWQRPLQSVENMVGKCTLEPGEKRAPKNAYTAELFILWSKLNNLRIRTMRHGERALDQDEKQKIAELAHKYKKLTYAQIRKKLEVGEDSRFNISYRKTGKDQQSWTAIRDAAERAAFIELKGYHALKDALGDSETDWQNRLNREPEKLDEAARTLAFNDDDTQISQLLADTGFSQQEVSALLAITDFRGTVDLSLKAIRNILPLMQDGHDYDKACETAGYDFHGKSGQKGGYVVPPFEDIRNPAVERALAQTRKAVNAVIRHYGMPERIIVELGRDLGKPKQERIRLEKTNKENEAQKERNRAHVRELLGREPSGDDIMKYRLWNEQQGFCIYSGEYISQDTLKDEMATQIDHILPYSRTWDDSYMNKVLCLTDENQRKGNMTPYEYLGDTASWTALEAFARSLPKPKADRLLREELGRDQEEGFKERNLNDTRYMAKRLKNHLEANLDLGEGRRVQTRNGALTAHLRNAWGFPGKNRRNDRHHALDAIVLACSTESMVHALSKWNKRDAKKGIAPPYPPKPWESFREDVKASLDNVFVTRMPDRKITGQAHEETIRSLRTGDDGERVVVQRVKLTSLTPTWLDGLVDRDTRNWRLYQTLKERLDAHDGKPDKAFKEPIYMPTNKPDKQGPPIHSVRVKVNEKSGIPVNQGLASNGDMVRTDVFAKPDKKGKMQYYLCPVYVHHFVQDRLPNKVVVPNKPEEEWPEIEDEYFLFSLYKNDLVRVQGKKIDVYGYFSGTDRSVAAIHLRAHDNDPEFGNNGLMRGIGVKNLLAFEKYSVDILGDKYRIKKEPRHGVAQSPDPESGRSQAAPATDPAQQRDG